MAGQVWRGQCEGSFAVVNDLYSESCRGQSHQTLRLLKLTSHNIIFWPELNPKMAQEQAFPKPKVGTWERAPSPGAPLAASLADPN